MCIYLQLHMPEKYVLIHGIALSLSWHAERGERKVLRVCASGSGCEAKEGGCSLLLQPDT